jgi:SAM-dependent methyltransferase
VIKQLIANRHLIEKEIADSDRRWYFSPVTYSQFKLASRLIDRYAYGRVIDIGCGDMPYKRFLSGKVIQYDGLDIYRHNDYIKYIVDIEDISKLPRQKYDTALCMEVLEHLPNPWLAIRNIHKVLNDKGVLILSTPHLSRLHDIPNDYYRYTEFGLKKMLKSAGFKVLALERKGSLLSFLGHQKSTFLLCVTWKIPLIREIAWFINRYLIVLPAYHLDAILDRRGYFSQGYFIVARKTNKKT